MRASQLLLLLLLALAAGGLLLLVLDSGSAPAENGAGDLDADPDVAGTSGGPEQLQVDPAPVEVVPEGEWPRSVDENPEERLDQPERLWHVRREVGPDAVDPAPTGEEALDLLRKTFAGRYAIRFRDQEALKAFRAGRYPEKVLPPGFSVHMLLDTLAEIGFRAAVRPDAVYLVRIKEP